MAADIKARAGHSPLVMVSITPTGKVRLGVEATGRVELQVEAMPNQDLWVQVMAIARHQCRVVLDEGEVISIFRV